MTPGLPLPASVSVGSLRPLAPVLHDGGEAAVAEAWRGVAAELKRGRVSERTVREALARHEQATVTPKRVYQTPLQPIEKSITRALARALELGAEHQDRVAPAAMRARCVKLAGQARELAAELERRSPLPGVRLAAIETEPFGVQLETTKRPVIFASATACDATSAAAASAAAGQISQPPLDHQRRRLRAPAAHRTRARRALADAARQARRAAAR